MPSQNSLHGEILIADIKKTLGFPRNDGQISKSSSNFEILIADIKKTLGFPRNDGKIQTLSSKFENYYSRHKENIRVSSKR